MEEGTKLLVHKSNIEVVKTNEIFDFLVNEKSITFPKDHWIPIKD